MSVPSNDSEFREGEGRPKRRCVLANGGVDVRTYSPLLGKRIAEDMARVLSVYLPYFIILRIYPNDGKFDKVPVDQGGRDLETCAPGFTKIYTHAKKQKAFRKMLDRVCDVLDSMGFEWPTKTKRPQCLRVAEIERSGLCVDDFIVALEKDTEFDEAVAEIGSV